MVGRPTERLRVAATADRIRAAARQTVLSDGFAGVSTRRVAEKAGVPLSQLHYHFGSKQNLILDVLRVENERLLERQKVMYAADAPLWKRWEQACDFLDDDLASGYVRILHESMAAGWADERVATEVRDILRGWFELLTAVATEAEERLGSIGPLTARELASLVVAAFLGGEAVLLVGVSEEVAMIRVALRRVGAVIRDREELSR